MGVYNKKKEEDDRYKWFREKEKKNKRIDNWFALVELAIIGLTIALWYYNWQLGIISLVWLVSNIYVYSEGCDWLCIDEIDMPDSALGLRLMFKSWIILLPLLAIGVVLVLLNWWAITLIYGFAISLIYPIAVQEFVFDF